MSMDRRTPFRDFDNLRQAMYRRLDDRFSGARDRGQANLLSVALDVYETDTGYELEASLPGVLPDDVDIQVDRDTVTLRGNSATGEDVNEGRTYFYRERRSGAFLRTVRLPEAIDPEKVEATLTYGILRVELPRLNQSRQRLIQVRPGAGRSNRQPANSEGAAASPNT